MKILTKDYLDIQNVKLTEKQIENILTTTIIIIKDARENSFSIDIKECRDHIMSLKEKKDVNRHGL